MPLTERIKALLQGAEGLEVEFKREPKSLRPEDITAFANHSGGTILVGVEERKHPTGERYGAVFGVKGVADALQAVQGIVASCNPKINVRIEDQEEHGKSILVLDVPEGPAKPYWTGAGLYVTRRAGRKDAIDPLMMRDLLMGEREVQEVAIPCLLISDTSEATVPEHHFHGYRFPLSVLFLWKEAFKHDPSLVSSLKDWQHRDVLVVATVQAVLLEWLARLRGFQVFFDGRPSPFTPRLFVDPQVEKKEVKVTDVPGAIESNPFPPGGCGGGLRLAMASRRGIDTEGLRAGDQAIRTGEATRRYPLARRRWRDSHRHPCHGGVPGGPGEHPPAGPHPRGRGAAVLDGPDHPRLP